MNKQVTSMATRVRISLCSYLNRLDIVGKSPPSTEAQLIDSARNAIEHLLDELEVPTKSQERFDGGAAFPQSSKSITEEGMSLLDYFAGQALVGLISFGSPYSPKEKAEMAYSQAEDMIKERGEVAESYATKERV